VKLLCTFVLSLFLPALVIAAPVTGRVVDPDNRPVAGALIIINGSGHRLLTAATNDVGEFSVELPNSGRFELRVAADGFRAEPVMIDASAESRALGDLRVSISAVSESVVVSAAQVEIPLSQASASTTIISGAELQTRQIHSVADALRSVPGLTVAATGGTGAVTGVFPRGGESNYTLVFIDDVPVNAFGGDFDFGHLSTINVDRIEIVRGPQSALFGSNAIGAVVRVVTRHGGAPAVSGTTEYGGYDTARFAGATSGSAGAFEWGASGERLTSDGYNGRTTAAGLTVENDDYTRSSGALSLGWRHGKSSIQGRLQQATDERGFPGPFGTNPIGVYEGIDTESRGSNDRTIASATATFPVTARLRALVQGAFNRVDSEFASAFGPSESNSNRSLGRGQVDFAVTPALEASAGVELQRERTGSTYITGTQGQQVQVRRFTAGYFVEGRWSSAQRLFITAGARLDDIRRERLEENPDAFSPRPVLDEDAVLSFNPRAGVAWFVRRRVSNYTKVRASAGTGIRPPDGFELAFTDNPSLKPERSTSAEAGIEQGFANGQATVEALGFWNNYDDLIIAVGSFRQSSRFRTDNIANARARGMELALAARHRINAGRPIDLRGRVSYTFLDSEVLAVDDATDAQDPFAAGDPLLRRPRHQFAAEILASSGRLSAFLTGGGRSRSLDVEPSFGTFGGLFYNDGFNSWNAGASWRVIGSSEVFARIENLFDKSYEEALGFPALGRRATLGLRIAAGR
jgi:outer membrane cobalamin receptor